MTWLALVVALLVALIIAAGLGHIGNALKDIADALHHNADALEEETMDGDEWKHDA